MLPKVKEKEVVSGDLDRVYTETPLESGEAKEACVNPRKNRVETQGHMTS